MREILDQHPELVNEVTTGGATPLHMCGMSKQNQLMTKLLIERGGDMCVPFGGGMCTGIDGCTHACVMRLTF